MKDVISLGEQYINDFPSSPREKGRNGKCPLDIVLCENCSLFQLRHTAPQELLYSRHYWYKSRTNDTIKSDLKGNVIRQYYGLDNQLIQGAADRNPVKWGKYTLTDIPIAREEEARAKADIFLVLPYGFLDEFLRRESDWLKAGGEFVVPLPEFRVIRN